MNALSRIIKKIDEFIGPPLVFLFSLFIPERKSSVSKCDTILIIRPGGIGDAVLLAALINAIVRKFPTLAIDILAEKRNFEVFRLCEGLRRVYRYDRPKDLISVLSNKYDTVVDTEQWYRLSAVIALLTGAPLRAGFSTNIRKKLFNLSVPYRQDEYELDAFFRLFQALPFLSGIKNEDIALCRTAIASGGQREILGTAGGKRVVAIFPGGSVAEKLWSSESFRETALSLSSRGFCVMALGASSDRALCASITDDISEASNIAGRFSITETAAFLPHVSLLITNDSGIMHLAAMLGVKTLSIFGPGNPEKWAPRGEGHICLYSAENCSPCSFFGTIKRCRNNLKCIGNISVSQVVDKALLILEQGDNEGN